jgi:aerobic-type carbon monoxide dehydrogenase small subunit (CoxS/CutS family)
MSPRKRARDDDEEEAVGSDEGLSRRDLLSGSVYAALGTGAPNWALPAAAAEAETSKPASTHDIVLRVNGVNRPLKVESRVTLAEALRGPLGLTGTKISCNRGACSACTVWLDGTPVCSCMTFAVEVGPREVTTIEGLAKDDVLHPVQKAFIEDDAMQCGFCTPGMALSAAALIARNPDPTAEDVERAISGHICRCGSYPHVVAATLAAAKTRKG